MNNNYQKGYTQAIRDLAGHYVYLLIHAYIKWVKDENCCKLVNAIEKVTNHNLLQNYSENPSYVIFNAYVIRKQNQNYNLEQIFISNFFKCIFEIVQQFEALKIVGGAKGINKHYIEDVIDPLVEVACECNRILYWLPKSDTETLIKYWNMSDLVDNNFDQTHKIHTIRLYKKNNCKKGVYILHNDNEIKISGVNVISKNPKKDRIITMYKAFSEAIDTNIYCPWCNPNDNIKHSTKQRKCKKCCEIEEFLLAHGNYKQKNLNMQITRKWDKNSIKGTVNKRGKTLIEKVDKIKNPNCEEKLIAHIKKVIISRYKLDI